MFVSCVKQYQRSVGVKCDYILLGLLMPGRGRMLAYLGATNKCASLFVVRAFIANNYSSLHRADCGERVVYGAGDNLIRDHACVSLQNGDRLLLRHGYDIMRPEMTPCPRLATDLLVIAPARYHIDHSVLVP